MLPSPKLDSNNMSLERRLSLYANQDKVFGRDKHFPKLDKIGEGTYGAVYKSVSPSGTSVAMKKIYINNEKEGFPITSVREIRILKGICHPNIVSLLDVVTLPNSIGGHPEIYMIFEFLHHDLAGLMASPEFKFEEGNIKYFMQSLLRGLYYLHDYCKLIHRDIKGSNILIGRYGEVKLADFGLSRQMSADITSCYTNRVVTLWYRAPELLLGEKRYSGAIDVWAAGCVFSEMMFGNPLFPGETEIQQLNLICKLVGSPTEDTYPGCSNLPIKMTKSYPNTFNQKYQKLKDNSPLAFDLLSKLICLDPKRRISAGEALLHPYFSSAPLPLAPNLEGLLPSHEFESRARRRSKKQKII